MTHPKTLTAKDVQRRFSGGPVDIETLMKFRERVLTEFTPPEDGDLPDEGDGGGGGRVLTFAATQAGAEEAAGQVRETERFRGTERLELEKTLNALAVDLLPPGDVKVAMETVRSGEWLGSKLMFQAVLQNLSDAAEVTQRSLDLELREKNEAEALRDARARITVDMMGRDIGRAILFALGAA